MYEDLSKEELILEIKKLSAEVDHQKHRCDELKKQLSTLSGREKELYALINGAKAILKYKSFTDSARAIFDHCKDVIGATSGYVALLNEDGDENEVLFLEAGGLPCSVNPELPMPIRGLRAEAYKKSIAVYHNDFMKSEWVKYMPDGHVVLKNVLFAPLTLDGKTMGIIGIANKDSDFTDKDAEIATAFGELAAIALQNSFYLDELIENKNRLKALSDASFEAIFLSEKGIFLDQNSVAEDMFGYTYREALGMHGTEWIIPDDREIVREKMMSGNTSPYEVTALRKDGSTFPAEIQAQMINYSGRSIRVTAVRDISNRKQKEKKLRESNERLKKVMDSIDAFIYIADMETYELLYVNEYGRKTWGDIEGQLCWKSIQKNQTGPCDFCTNHKLLTSEGKPTGVYQWEFQNTNNERWYDCRDTAIQWTNGNLVRMEIATDITERKLMEEEIEKNNIRLELINDIATQIVSGMRVEDIIHNVVTQIAQYFPDYRVAYSTVDINGKLNVIDSLEPEGMPGLSGIEADLNIALDYKKALIDKNVLVVSDVSKDPLFVSLQSAMSFGKTKAVLDVPIVHTKKLTGVLCFDAPEPHQWEIYEIETLKEVAAYLSIAIKDAMTESQLRIYETIAQSSSDLMSCIDADYVYRLVNNSYEQFFKIKKEDIIGRSAPELLGNEVFESISKPHFDQCIMGNEVCYQDWFYKPGDGKRYLDVKYHPVFEQDNTINGIVATIRDITENKQAEEDLKRQKNIESELSSLSAKLLATSDLTDISYYVLETAKKLTNCHYGFAGSIDQDTGHLISHSMTRDIWSECDIPDKSIVFKEFAGLWGWVLDNKKPLLTNHPDQDPRSTGIPDGHIPIQSFLSVPAIINDKLVGQIALANAKNGFKEEDLNTLKKISTIYSLAIQHHLYEQNIVIEKNKAEMANRAKSIFLANMSHEIRTPLNSIIGFSEILVKNDETYGFHDTAKNYLNNILLSGKSLLELINNLLDISKIESGKMEVFTESVNLPKLLEEVYRINRIQAEKKQLDYQLQIEPDILENISTDKNKLRQVLINLIGNAIKFTPTHKSIRIKAQQTENQIIISIIDKGIGIPKNKRDQIFQEFIQVDNRITRQFGGTGLGLTISKKIIRLLNGDIEVEETPGGGSTFIVKIPAIAAMSAENVSLREPNEIIFDSSNTVLLFEDNLMNQEMAQALFERLGLEIQIAENGEEGMAALYDLKAKSMLPDLILMDMHMPVMDGMETTRRLRSLPEFRNIPIVALSADAFTEQQIEAQSVGMDDYLTKPLEMNKLIGILEKYLKCQSKGKSQSDKALNPRETQNKKTYIDNNVLLKMKQSLRDRLINMFFEQAPSSIEKIKNHADQKDAEKLGKEAHYLKGSALALGAVDMVEICKKLQTHEEHNDLSDIQSLIEQLEFSYEQTCFELKDIQ